MSFCTNCGTELDDDASFCTNCGEKVIKSNEKPKGLFSKIKKGVETRLDWDINLAKAERDRIIGGIIFTETFAYELDKYGLAYTDGVSIKKQIDNEINTGQLKSINVENRVNELLLEYKSKIEEEIKEFQFIDTFFESEEIKSKIEKENLPESKVISIKSHMKNKVRFNETKLSEDEIIKELNKELKNEIINHREDDIKENRIKYLEESIKDSHPYIKLATFEKKYVNNIKLDGTADQMKDELNTIAKRIINTHEKIGEYDFAGKLIEEAGLTNRVDPIGLNKRVRKEPNFSSYVFLKICDEHMKIVGSDIKTISLNTRLGIDMTIFFRDINSVNYATNWQNNGEIKFDLNNRKFKLIAIEDEKSLEEFYKLLNNKWIKSKNNETVNASSTHKNEVTSADELMKYAELYEKGLLSEDEFNAIKKKLLQL